MSETQMKLAYTKKNSLVNISEKEILDYLASRMAVSRYPNNISVFLLLSPTLGSPLLCVDFIHALPMRKKNGSKQLPPHIPPAQGNSVSFLTVPAIVSGFNLMN